jgi:queuosine precursor transporter
MPNELIWFLFIIFNLSVAVLIYKRYGKIGLYGLIAMNIVLCNIQVIKQVDLFGLSATLGNVLYASIFFSTDLLNELYGKDEAKRAVVFGFIFLIISMVVMQIALEFEPNENDFIQSSLEQIFSFFPRVVLASLTAYLISQFHDVWAFNFWKKLTKKKHLWLRNNLSTMVSQLIDSLIFCTMAFWGLFSLSNFMQIVFTTYILKWIIAAADTPFLYLAVKISKKKDS